MQFAYAKTEIIYIVGVGGYIWFRKWYDIKKTIMCNEFARYFNYTHLKIIIQMFT